MTVETTQDLNGLNSILNEIQAKGKPKEYIGNLIVIESIAPLKEREKLPLNEAMEQDALELAGAYGTGQEGEERLGRLFYEMGDANYFKAVAYLIYPHDDNYRRALLFIMYEEGGRDLVAQRQIQGKYSLRDLTVRSETILETIEDKLKPENIEQAYYELVKSGKIVPGQEIDLSQWEKKEETAPAEQKELAAEKPDIILF